MPQINGKEVVLIDHLTGKQWWELAPIVAAFGEAGSGGAVTAKALFRALDWDDVCLLVRVMVAGWEFDGDPGDPETMVTGLGLGVFELATLCIQHMTELMPQSGESASAST